MLKVISFQLERNLTSIVTTLLVCLNLPIKWKNKLSQPKIVLQFELSTSGISKLVKTVAIVEEMLNVTEEIELDNDDDQDTDEQEKVSITVVEED